MGKLNRIIQIIFLTFFIFIICFGVQKAYSLGLIYYIAIFVVLILIPIVIQDPNIYKFKASFGKNKNIIIEKMNTEAEKIIKSSKSDDDKVIESQKLIDEAFEIGYKIGSGKVINQIQNVKITKDKNDKILTVQYDEN